MVLGVGGLSSISTVGFVSTLGSAFGRAQPRLLAAAGVDTRSTLSTDSTDSTGSIGSIRICTGGFRTLLTESFAPGGRPFRLGAGGGGMASEASAAG